MAKKQAVKEQAELIPAEPLTDDEIPSQAKSASPNDANPVYAGEVKKRGRPKKSNGDTAKAVTKQVAKNVSQLPVAANEEKLRHVLKVLLQDSDKLDSIYHLLK